MLSVNGVVHESVYYTFDGRFFFYRLAILKTLYLFQTEFFSLTEVDLYLFGKSSPLIHSIPSNKIDSRKSSLRSDRRMCHFCYTGLNGKFTCLLAYMEEVENKFYYCYRVIPKV